MAQTSRYALPLLQAGQAQKEITHNEAVAQVDALLHLAVESRGSIAPPSAPVAGTAWLVPVAATGAWAGHDGAIAAFDDAGWSFIAPRDGCLAFVRDEGVFVHFQGGSWRDGWPVPALSIGGQTLLAATATAVAAPSGGTVVDVEVRAALGQLLTALRSMGLVAAG